MVGVSGCGKKKEEPQKIRVPKGTEVIVDYRFFMSSASFKYCHAGTALIPKVEK